MPSATRLGADGDAPVRRHTPVADVAAHPEVVVDLLVRVEVEEGACWPTGPSAQWPGKGEHTVACTKRS
jgi:hypothetical protein